MKNETELIHELMDILESLTPGGSEFHNNPKMCEQFIRDRLATIVNIAIERNKLRKENDVLKNKLNIQASELMAHWQAIDCLADENKELKEDMEKLDLLLWGMAPDHIDKPDVEKAREITMKYAEGRGDK